MPYDVTADPEMQRSLHWYNGWSRAHQKTLVEVERAVPWSIYRASRMRRRMLSAHARFLRHLLRVDELKRLLIDEVGARQAHRAAKSSAKASSDEPSASVQLPPTTDSKTTPERAA